MRIKTEPELGAQGTMGGGQEVSTLTDVEEIAARLAALHHEEREKDAALHTLLLRRDDLRVAMSGLLRCDAPRPRTARQPLTHRTPQHRAQAGGD